MQMSFRSRLVPSETHARRLERIPEPCRRRENQCRAERRDASHERGEPIGTVRQIARVKDLNASAPSAENVHRHVLHVVVADLDKAFGAFVRRVKAGEQPGYPRFKVRTRLDSFGFTEDGNGFTPDGRRLRLSRIGRVAVRRHRPLEGRGTTVRITRRAGRWVAYFPCAGAAAPLPATGKEVGIDGGMSNPITTSEGEQVAHPAWYRSSQRKMRVLHRRVARRTKGSTNRRTAVRMLQRQHARRANRRKDFLNKIVHNLMTRSDRIVLDDLRITRMVRNRHLATSIVAAGWGYLVQHLTSKAEESGRVVAQGDPRHTFKTCSGCGHGVQDQT